VKPLEGLLFLRSVRSRSYFEQMIGRGVRIINDTDFQAVTDDAKHKDRFVVVDAVGVTDTPLVETMQPLERRPTASLETLFKQVGFGNRDPEVASSIAGRLARLDQHLTRDDREALAKLAGGLDLGAIARGIVEALDPDEQLAAAEQSGVTEDDEAGAARVAADLLAAALNPLVANPDLRTAIVEVRKSYEQTIDEASKDAVLFAGYSEEGREKAASLISSFKQYIEEHRDEIRALDILYSRPYGERLTFSELKELVRAIERPPRQWTPEKLWHAYEMLDRSKVRGSGGQMLTDVVSLVRYTLQQDDELVPFREQADERFSAWLATQDQHGTTFTPEQLQWLVWMKENIVEALEITPESFEYTPFVEHGGIGRAYQVFGERLSPLMDELTEALAA
jgi:type I restriction enzyme R subunit